MGGVGHDPDRLRQQLRLLHRARGAGPGDQPAVRRHRRRGRARPPPTASPRSPCSARTSTATAATSPCRAGGSDRCGRCSPTCCGRSARSTASAGSATPARTPRTSAPRRSRPWPRRRRCASTSTCRCSRAATGCWPPCTAATPPSATSSGSPRPGPPSHDLAVTTDIIVGLPRRDRRRLRAHPRGRGRGRLRQRLHVHLQPPARHRGGRAWSTSSCPPRSSAERFERLRVVVERSALARHEARVGRVEEVARRGPVAARTPTSSPAAPARTSSSTSPRRRRCGPAPTPTVGSPSAAPHHLRGDLSRSTAPADAQTRLPLAGRVIELTEEPYDGDGGRRRSSPQLLAGPQRALRATVEAMTPASEADGRRPTYLAEVTSDARSRRPHGVFVVALARRAAGGLRCGAVRAVLAPTADGIGEIKRMYTVADAASAGA